MKSHYKSFFELTSKTAVVTGAVGILGQRILQRARRIWCAGGGGDLDQDRCTAFAES